jgi:hypothetical protein
MSLHRASANPSQRGRFTFSRLRPIRSGLAPRTRWLLVAAAMGAFLLAAQPASAAQYALGDVFAGVGNGQIKQFSPTGTLKDTLDTTSGSEEDTGMCFDPSGNLYSTNFSANDMTKFDDAGNVLVYPFGSGFNASPESCVRDASGHIFAGQANGGGDILEFTASGGAVDSFDPATEERGTDWIDLAADGCTMYYTSEGSSVKRFNVCTDTQLSDFATGLTGSNAYAFRLLPGGGALVADTEQVVRLDSSGSVVKTYPASDYDSSFLFALNLDPDGTTFWTADISTGLITRINIATGAQVKQIDGNPNTDLAGLAVFGERCQSCPASLTLKPPTATNQVGSSHTVTATLVNPSGSSGGQTILFKVTGANSASGSKTTDSGGEASFTYSGTNAGNDNITACFDANKNHACDSAEAKATAKKTWTGKPPPSGGPVWEGFHTDPSSGCSARVQQPYLDANQQVTSYTEVICPKATKLTIRSRLRSDHRFDRPLFRNITVAQKGCVPGCVVNQPAGTRFYKLTCPKSSTRTINQKYFTDIVLYAGTHLPAVTPFPQRSRPATLSPYCAS